MNVYEKIALHLDAYKRCEENGTEEWRIKHKQEINALIAERFPHGSGFDSGVNLEFDKSEPNKLVFYTDFHHMDEHGYYDGWTNHVITVRPSFIHRIDFTISGRNRNDIKDYIVQAFPGTEDIEK